MDRQIDVQTKRLTSLCVDRQTDRWTNEATYRPMYGHTVRRKSKLTVTINTTTVVRQTDKQTDRQTDRQTEQAEQTEQTEQAEQAEQTEQTDRWVDLQTDGLSKKWTDKWIDRWTY